MGRGIVTESELIEIARRQLRAQGWSAADADAAVIDIDLTGAEPVAIVRVPRPHISVSYGHVKQGKQ